MIIIFKVAFVLIMGVLIYQIVLTIFNIRENGKFKTKRRIIFLKNAYSSVEPGKIVINEQKTFFSFIKVTENFRKRLVSAGIKLKPEEYIVAWFVSAVLPTILALSIYGFGVQMFLALVIGAMVPPLLLRYIEKKRLTKFTEQLNDALMIISNSLRSGFTFRHAITRVAQDMPEPISTEMGRVVREVNYGESMESALGELAKRMQSKELEMVNSAVAIHAQAGGNLAEIIEKVSKTISDRIEMKRKIKALTAQGRMSGIVIGMIPVFIFTAISFINPEYMSFFYNTTVGIITLIVCIVLEVIGLLVIRKLVDVKY